MSSSRVGPHRLVEERQKQLDAIRELRNRELARCERLVVVDHRRNSELLDSMDSAERPRNDRVARKLAEIKRRRETEEKRLLEALSERRSAIEPDDDGDEDEEHEEAADDCCNAMGYDDEAYEALTRGNNVRSLAGAVRSSIDARSVRPCGSECAKDSDRDRTVVFRCRQ